MNSIFFLFHSLFFILPLLIAIAFLTLIERKVIGYIQSRKGPNIVGPYGILQPFADALKLFIKETLKPHTASPYLFFLSPVIFLFTALFLWSLLPITNIMINTNFSLLFILGISSLAVYALLGSGWASNSKYALLGSLRAVAQTISYEITLGLIILSILIWSSSFSLNNIVNTQNFIWFLFPHFPLFVMWWISSLAETNRAPFDLTEGESEIVSGYNIEYAGGPFALFFIAEYSNIIFINLLSVLLFLGSGHPFNNFIVINLLFLTFKTLFFVFSFLWIRASYPRLRYDQLMSLTWKNYLPLSLAFLSFSLTVLILLNSATNF
uniref:NADH-ubiquinone oxidoreductase chain 1 n=2 Tax=unclassified Scotoplanes TaxID=2647124 RepID=A0A3G9GU71_9ECHN|nr:NADH dehydrogenase subunit 1 [Scotoplanes sp. TT-2017]BBF98418.1 NADH dehydrogenase subunit 1 [Scotoplanes sp. H5]